MGTSSGYSPGTGPRWGDAKAKAKKAVEPSATPSDIRSAIRAHIKAYTGGSTGGGGAGTRGQGGARGSGGGGFHSARRVAGGLAGFVRDVRDLGLDKTLEKHKLGHLVGRSVEEIIDGIISTLTDGADYIEDVDARIAAANVIDEIAAEAVTPEELELKLQELSDDKMLCDLLSRYFRYFLIEHFIRNYWKHLQGKYSNSDIRRFRDELTEHLFSGLEFELEDESIEDIDWSSYEAKELIARVEERTFEVYAG